ncbi:hypothetical protein D9M73_220090 [compost metagenome]
MEEHGTQTVLGVGLALQRCLLEPVQGFAQVFWRLRVVILAQFELRLGIPRSRRLLAGLEGVCQVFRLNVQGAAARRRNQQRVTALRQGQQGLKKQQAAQGQGAAGAVHGDRLTSAKLRPMSLVAHYGISSANLTKFYSNFCLVGEVS